MNMDPETNLRGIVERLMSGEITDEERVSRDEHSKKADADRAAVVEKVAQTFLGVTPEQPDTAYTQYPLMAGVLRGALREAFDAGTALVAKQMLEAVLKNGKQQ